MKIWSCKTNQVPQVSHQNQASALIYAIVSCSKNSFITSIIQGTYTISNPPGVNAFFTRPRHQQQQIDPNGNSVFTNYGFHHEEVRQVLVIFETMKRGFWCFWCQKNMWLKFWVMKNKNMFLWNGTLSVFAKHNHFDMSHLCHYGAFWYVVFTDAIIVRFESVRFRWKNSLTIAIDLFQATTYKIMDLFESVSKSTYSSGPVIN